MKTSISDEEIARIGTWCQNRQLRSILLCVFFWDNHLLADDFGPRKNHKMTPATGSTRIKRTQSIFFPIEDRLCTTLKIAQMSAIKINNPNIPSTFIPSLYMILAWKILVKLMGLKSTCSWCTGRVPGIAFFWHRISNTYRVVRVLRVDS